MEIILLLFIFVLAAFLGFELISKVPSQLHTPLMSGSNAISADWYDKIYTDAKLARIHSDLYHNKLTKQLFMSDQERPLLVVPYEEYWNNERKLIEDILH